MIRFLLVLLLLVPALSQAAGDPFVAWKRYEISTEFPIYPDPKSCQDCYVTVCQNYVAFVNAKYGSSREYVEVYTATGGQPGCRTKQGASTYGGIMSPQNYCPAGSTAGPVGYCTWNNDCPAGQVRNDNGVCSDPPPPPCNAGETVSQGLYSIGTQASNNPPLFACSGTCEVQFDGVVPSKQQVINGVMNYFAEGKYYKTGESCSSGSAPPGAEGNGLPPPSCAPGQAPGTINGKFVCIDQGTQEPVNPNTPQDGGDEHEDPPPGDPGEPCTPGTSTRTINYPDGSRKIITTTKNEDCSTDTSTQNIPGPTGGNAAGNDGNGDGEPTPGSGGGGGSGGSGPGDGDEDEGDDVESGDATAPADLYTPADGEKTFDSIMADFSDRVQDAPFYSAVDNFFDVSIPGGGCGGLGGSVSFGGATFVADLDSTLCSGTAINMYALLGIAVIFAASWLAFRIAFL